MQDCTLKKILGFAVRHRLELSTLLSYFRADDLENGIFALPERVVNNELRPYILLQTSPYIEDYSLQFSGGMLHIMANINAKQLGPLSIRYMLEINDLTFNRSSHKITFKYYEDIRSEGGIIHKAALKAISLKGSYLQQAVSFLHMDFIDIHDSHFTIDLDKTDRPDLFSGDLSLGFISSENGTLKLAYKLESSENDNATVSGQATKKTKVKVQGGYLKDMLNYSDRF